MEERRLNFNIPLLSVRRSTTPTRSSARNDEKVNEIENSQLNRQRTLASPDCGLDQVTEPVAVPFMWEKIPGRRKDNRMHDSKSHEDAPRKALSVVKHIEDKKPEDRVLIRPQINAKSFNKTTSGLNCSKEEANEDNDDEDAEDAYSDALDTLSPTDSFSMNCSFSGVSGFDSKVAKPSGTHSTDQHTRDFMMNRFLPAAKAMTLEPPHYAGRRQSVSGEQPKQIVKVIPRDKTPPVIRNELRNIPPYYHQDKEEDETEDECDNFSDYSSKITAKGCSFLPRLCIKNSLYLLNPVPGLKVKTQTSGSSVRDVKKLTKAIFSRSQSPTAKKPTRDAVTKQKLDKEVSSPRLQGVDNKLTGGSNRFIHAADRQMISRTSPFRRSGCLSPCRDETPQSPFRGRGGSLGIPKELEGLKPNKLNSFNRGAYSKSQELVPYNAIRRGSRPASPAVEKTLYVDTVNVAGLLCSNSGKKGFVDSAEKDLKALFQEIAVVKSSFREMKSPKSSLPAVESKLENKSLHSRDLSSNRGRMEMAEDAKESRALVPVSTESDQISNRHNTGSEETSLVPIHPPLAPLLPKTPSESWLWRTLPSMSSQNLYRGTSFQSKRQDPKTSSATTKWENIVKSSYLHHDHVRYSEELFPHAPK
ncbi:uncharacterized protein LOC126674344 [Mercurialis annua]|uniref:uncharacterized protein LOC126674344 n=1 Tax=Mercurialis annua TaxID=3986 RepID=UPI002160C1C5|nr:uncharacterized protein LOC126674344 [Mercurialis annua]